MPVGGGAAAASSPVCARRTTPCRWTPSGGPGPRGRTASRSAGGSAAPAGIAARNRAVSAESIEAIGVGDGQPGADRGRRFPPVDRSDFDQVSGAEPVGFNEDFSRSCDVEQCHPVEDHERHGPSKPLGGHPPSDALCRFLWTQRLERPTAGAPCGRSLAHRRPKETDDDN